jgi:nicotinate-nucleotide pyrophosphorylase
MKPIKEYKSWKSNYNLSDSHEYKNDMISLDNINIDELPEHIKNYLNSRNDMISLDNINIDDLPEEIRNYFKLHLKNKMISL